MISRHAICTSITYFLCGFYLQSMYIIIQNIYWIIGVYSVTQEIGGAFYSITLCNSFLYPIYFIYVDG